MKRSETAMNDSRVAKPVVDESAGEPAPDDSETPADSSVTDAVDATDERLGELERELTTERDKYLRLAAEFDNFRKRMTKERIEAEGRGQAELVRQLLDPLDDIARFADLDPETTDSATVVQGVDMVEKKLEKSLRSAGLESISPADVAFDPSLHEAVATIAADSPDLDGTVAQVYQVGYTFKGQLLRPARVVVRQYQGAN